jgi:protein phosphatase PTC2/3
MKHEISSDGSNGLLPSLSAKIIPSTARKSELFRIASEKLPNLSRHKTNPDQLNSFISKRLEEIKTENIKISSKKCGKVRIYAANTTAGISQFHNEDRVRIILNIKKPETIPQDKWPHSSFYGIYDGNNGKFCAEFLKQNLHNRIFTDSNFPFRPKKAILSGFHKTEEEFLSIAEENNDFSGSSALICLILGNKCYIAQTGDTRAILSASNGNKIFQITEDHNLKNQSEKDRIISAGGKIVCNFVLDKAGNRIPKGGYRIMPSNLCITRSLGNFQVRWGPRSDNPDSGDKKF